MNEQEKSIDCSVKLHGLTTLEKLETDLKNHNYRNLLKEKEMLVAECKNDTNDVAYLGLLIMLKRVLEFED